MNKEFRVWDSTDECWIDSSHLRCDVDGYLYLPYGSTPQKNVKRFVIQQYTGLTDSTGRKIFEGDVVDYRYDGMSEFEKERYSNFLISPVYWEYERWRIKYSAASYAWPLMKVIGNIFETPELLK